MSDVTVGLLIDLGAERSCPQLVRFAELFPDGAKITDAAFDRAAEAGLDVAWLAARLLPAPARAEYERTIDAAWAEYERTIDAAWAEYERTVDAAWAVYERTIVAAWAVYERTIVAARAVYERTIVAARAVYEWAIVAALKTAFAASYWGKGMTK